jgi:hypothetical protein
MTLRSVSHNLLAFVRRHHKALGALIVLITYFARDEAQENLKAELEALKTAQLTADLEDVGGTLAGSETSHFTGIRATQGSKQQLREAVIIITAESKKCELLSASLATLAQEVSPEKYDQIMKNVITRVLMHLSENNKLYGYERTLAGNEQDEAPAAAIKQRDMILMLLASYESGIVKLRDEIRSTSEKVRRDREARLRHVTIILDFLFVIGWALGFLQPDSDQQEVR